MARRTWSCDWSVKAWKGFHSFFHPFIHSARTRGCREATINHSMPQHRRTPPFPPNEHHLPPTSSPSLGSPVCYPESKYSRKGFPARTGHPLEANASPYMRSVYIIRALLVRIRGDGVGPRDDTSIAPLNTLNPGIVLWEKRIPLRTELICQSPAESARCIAKETFSVFSSRL
jgi:hypothetical protein